MMAQYRQVTYSSDGESHITTVPFGTGYSPHSSKWPSHESILLSTSAPCIPHAHAIQCPQSAMPKTDFAISIVEYMIEKLDSHLRRQSGEANPCWVRACVLLPESGWSGKGDGPRHGKPLEETRRFNQPHQLDQPQESDQTKRQELIKRVAADPNRLERDDRDEIHEEPCGEVAVGDQVGIVHPPRALGRHVMVDEDKLQAHVEKE
mmetsp:Transcript_42651/g.96446  ORF Transcript_42651/g.96446 Transcript_42651/m.96446 type:complete len:206 (+) Transcript_42651:1933-2550(+)